MKNKKTKYVSLQKKTFRVILTGALLLILFFSVISICVFGYNILLDYHDESRHLAGYTMTQLDQEYVEELFIRTREIYDSMPDEVRSDPYSETFLEAVRPLVDDEYEKVRQVLVNCRVESENRNVSLVMTDPERSAYIFVVDGDEPKWAYLPGQWIETKLDKIDGIVKSSWRLMVTHEPEYGWVGTDFNVIRASDGSKLGYLVMDMDINDFFTDVFSSLFVMLPAAVAVVLMIAYRAGVLTKRHILSHLEKLTGAARDYAKRDKVMQSDEMPSYFQPLEIATHDEMEELWRSMTDMETDVNETMHRLREVTAERERIEAELSIASKIQEGLLPRQFPAFPDRKEFDIYASMTPAKEVGGDLYDFFLIDDDHLGVVIADVSGKGISAALFMVNAKATLRNEIKKSPERLLEACAKANDRLMEQNEAEMFVTVWIGVLRLSTGEMIYVNAGHEYPAIRRNGGLFRVEKDAFRPHGGARGHAVQMRHDGASAGRCDILLYGRCGGGEQRPGGTVRSGSYAGNAESSPGRRSEGTG